MNTTNSKAFPAIIIVIILAIFIGVGYAIQSSRDTTGDDAEAPKAVPTVVDDDVQVTVVDDYGLALGDPAADAKVEVFFDFACPHCADFENASAEAFSSLAADGQALVVHRPMAFLNEYSWKAMNTLAAVLDAGDAAQAHALYRTLIASQPHESAPDNNWYVDQAAAVGVTGKVVEEAINDVSFEQWVTNANDDASKRGVVGTPTVFVNGDRIGGNTIDELLNNALDKVAAANS